MTESGQTAHGETSGAPLSETEIRVQAIWRDILRNDAIAPDDHLFDLGGDSLSTTLIAAAAEQAFSVEILPGDVYANPTVKYFALHIDALRAEAAN